MVNGELGKGADGACSRNAFIGTWGEVITAPMRRLGRPYFRVGLLLSVCLSGSVSVSCRPCPSVSCRGFVSGVVSAL